MVSDSTLGLQVLTVWLADAVKKAAGSAGSSLTARSGDTHGSIRGFVATTAQQAMFNRHMAMACITGCIPFSFFENRHLCAAAGVFGAKLPSRRALATTVLDSVFNDVKLGTTEKLAALTYIDASSDGWRKKTCEQGAALMNFCALTTSGALFVEALNCSEHRKDSSAIAHLLEQQAELMTGGETSRLAGWLLDNTKANWSAMQTLQVAHPEWIMRGCIAHGLSLAMKDFTKFATGTGRGAIEKQWGLHWAQDTLAKANKIANFLNDSGPAKVLVQQAQVEVYGKRKQITVNVPTRFASNHLVMKSIVESKQALVQAVGSEAWSALKGPGGTVDGNGAKVKAIVERALDATYFWENLVLLLELLQPFSDAIHQLEADRPMLGQCHVVLLSLHKHVQDFVAKYKDLRGGNVVLRLKETFQRRYHALGGGMRAPIYNAAYTAAYMLDPYNAVLDAKGVWQLPPVEQEHLQKAIALVQRIAGPAASQQMRKLELQGYPSTMGDYVAVAAAAEGKEDAIAAAQPDPASKQKKRKLVEMVSMQTRINIWEKYGKEPYPDLVNAVIRLLSCHATTCAVERNWSLWGRVYSAARNALGMERSKKMIAICTNSRVHVESDFAVSLSVIEGEL